jgi:glycine/D-amino acid oxidase-like deaminating enzyme
MDLRSGCPYWTREVGDEPVRAPVLDGDVSAEVVVLGAGITGALAAHCLTEAGVDCVVVDRRDVARGSTAASTGLLQYEVDKPLVELSAIAGPHVARRAYQLGREAIDEFARLVAKLGDGCGFARTRSLFLATSAASGDALRAECDARRAIGLAVDYLDGAALKRSFGIDRPAALLSAQAASVDPVRLTSALIERAAARGARVFGHTEVTRYQPGADGVTLTTSAGCAVRARHVLFATGYETPEFLRDVRVRLRTTYALATEAVGSAHPMPLIWETGTPYFYLRSDGGRLIIGGEDDDFEDPGTRDARLPQKVHVLRRKLAALMPAVGDVAVDCSWAGTFAETPDALPYVGPHREFPGGLFALGYGGNGITFALIAARILRDRILGRANADAELFRFDRRLPT